MSEAHAARTPEEIRRDIEHTREELADTAAALAEKADVRARAHERLDEAKSRITGTVEGSGFTIEKIVFEARPHHYVTANLYLPAQRTGPTP